LSASSVPLAYNNTMPAARPSGKPYDATTKFLVDTSPIDWLHFFGIPGDRAEVIDADLSTVTTDADRVIRFYAPDGILHTEFESGHSAYLAPERLLSYSVLLSYAYGVPVTSALILLRKEADSPRLNGTFVYRRPGGTRPYLTVATQCCESGSAQRRSFWWEV